MKKLIVKTMIFLADALYYISRNLYPILFRKELKAIEESVQSAGLGRVVWRFTPRAIYYGRTNCALANSDNKSKFLNDRKFYSIIYSDNGGSAIENQGIEIYPEEY